MEAVAVDLSREGDSGLLKELIREGAGDSVPHHGDDVTIHYTGQIEDGTVFDCSRDRGEPYTFNIDGGRVLDCLAMGVATMKAGEVCKLTSAPKYAYGEKGMPSLISPTTVVTFEVELLHWKGADITEVRDGGIRRSIIKRGHGKTTPTDDSLVTVNLFGSFNGRTFDERKLTFRIGDGFQHDVIAGVEAALKKCKEGEHCLLVIASKYAFGEAGSAQFEVPPDATVEYKMELLSFVKTKDQWELSGPEKIELAERFKTRGTSLFKLDFVELALTNYKRARSTLDDDPNYSPAEVTARSNLLLSVNLNCALCQLRLERWNEALVSCNNVLAVDSRNEKALYRQAQAYMGRRDYEQAIDAYKAVLQVNESNSAAKNSIAVASQKLKKENSKVKSKFAGMFQKFVDNDSQEEALAKARGQANTEPIGYWSNDMAAGMMSLQQEMEAFGERMPERSRRSSDGSGNGSPRQ